MVLHLAQHRAAAHVVDVAAPTDEHRDEGHHAVLLVAAARLPALLSAVDGGLLAVVLQARVGAQFQQRARHAQVHPAVAADDERGRAVPVARIHIRATLHQRAQHVQALWVKHREEQRRAPLNHQVGVGPLLDEPAHAGHVAILHGHHQGEPLRVVVALLVRPGALHTAQPLPEAHVVVEVPARRRRGQHVAAVASLRGEQQHSCEGVHVQHLVS